MRQTKKFPHRWLRNQNRTLTLAWGFYILMERFILQLQMQKLKRPFWAATAWSPPREGPGPVLSGDTLGTGVDLPDVAWVMRKWDLDAPCMLPLRWV